MRTCLLFLLVLFAAQGTLSGKTLHVPSQYTNINEAVRVAATGDTIQLASGEYVISEPIRFLGKRLALRGSGREATTLRLSDEVGMDAESSLAVVSKSDDVVICDLTFLAGRGAQRVSLPWPRGDGTCFEQQVPLLKLGGAILVTDGGKARVASCMFNNCKAFSGGAIAAVDSELTVVDCRFVKNETADFDGSGGWNGGALSLLGSTVSTISTSDFLENIAHEGGAIYIACSAQVTINRCSLLQNQAFAGAGGGISCNTANATISDCEIAENSTLDALCGGGLYVAPFSVASVKQSYLHDNLAFEAGGAVCVMQNGLLILSASRIENNRTSDFGGGLYCAGDVQVSNTYLIGNRSGSGGAAIDVERAGRVDATSCLFATNSTDRGTLRASGDAVLNLTHITCAENPGGGIVRSEEAALNVKNSIVLGGDSLWGSLTSVGDGGSVAVSYTCVDGAGAEYGPGNITQCKPFVERQDFRLGPDSSARDAAQEVEGIVTDLDGNARICGARPDMGAYEYGDCHVFRRGDIDRDGFLSLTDAIRILNYLIHGTEEIDCLSSADLQDDGKVDLSDAVYELSFLFLGSKAPAQPWPECGLDATSDALSCSYSTCLSTEK